MVKMSQKGTKREDIMRELVGLAFGKLDPAGAFSLLGEVRDGFDRQYYKVFYPAVIARQEEAVSSRVLAVVDFQRKRGAVCFGADIRDHRSKNESTLLSAFEGVATGVYHSLFRDKGFAPSQLKFSYYLPHQREWDACWEGGEPVDGLFASRGIWGPIDLEYDKERYYIASDIKGGCAIRRRSFLIPSLLGGIVNTETERELDLSAYVRACSPTVFTP